MKLNVVITGLDEVDKMLGSVEPKVQKKLTRKTLRAGAKMLLPQLKELVPVRTGNLKNSLKIKSGKRSKKKLAMDVAGGSTNKGDAWYGFLVNYGTKHIVGRHYLKKAADANRQRIQEFMRVDIIELIKKEL